MNWKTGLAVVLLSGCMDFAVAATDVDETRTMPPDGRLHVDNLAGSITITGWDRNEMHLTGELGDGVEELEISESSRGVTILVRNRENQRYVDESHLVLKVPVAASVIAEGISSDIDIGGLDGGSLDLSTVSGDIEVVASASRVEIESVSGDVSWSGAAPRLSVETVSGEIEVEGVEGEVQVTTVSGDVELEAGALSIARFETVSGDIRTRLSLANGGRLNADSMSGDVSVRLPAGQQGDFSAQTFSGDIRTAFGEISRGSWGPGRRLDHREGSGGAIIEIESFSGDIRIETH